MMHQLHTVQSALAQTMHDFVQTARMGHTASLLGARTLLGAPGLTTRIKKLLVTRCIATSSKDASTDQIACGPSRGGGTDVHGSQTAQMFHLESSQLHGGTFS